MTKPILSLDGGGVRALVFLQTLKWLEQRTGKQCIDIFEVCYGTSTGGLIALGLAQGRSAAACEQIVLRRAADIFPREWAQGLRSLAGPRYPASGIEHVLQQELPPAHNERAGWAYVVAYDIQAQDTLILDDSWGFAWQRARATSAAPTYFPPFRYGARCLVDGGIVANDPVLLAAGHLNTWGVPVLSLGTGARPHGVSYEKCAGWGQLQWASPLIDAMLTGSQDDAEEAAGRLLPDYTRVNCVLPAGLEAMDAIEPKTLVALQLLGLKMVQDNIKPLQHFVSKL